MYIPKPVFDDCIGEISASGGDVMYDYITGSQIRRVHYFGNTTGSHEFEVYEGCTDSTQLFMVGGGGAGGFGERRLVGIGHPYNLGPPPSYISCTNTAYQTGGGGGGGGVLSINPDLELTGSLPLLPGKYPIIVGGGGGLTVSTDGTINVNSDGQDTKFRYKYQLPDYIDLPSGSATSSRYEYDSIEIKAGGGGAGGRINWVATIGDPYCGNTDQGPQFYQIANPPGDGGSGGGGGTCACGDAGNPYNVSNPSSGSNIYPYGNQGIDGDGFDYSQPDTFARGYNGGGWNENFGGPFSSARGYSQRYALGGNAQNTYTCGAPGVVGNGNARGLFSFIYDSGSQVPYFKGSAGQAYVWDFTSSYTVTAQDSYFYGQPGEAIITYALSGSQLTNGRLHYIDGGATGGTFSFIPCGEVRIETLDVPAGKQACICAMDTGLDLYLGGTYRDPWYKFVDLQPPLTASDYDWEPSKMLDQLPSGSGTVTFTTGSSCKAYVPFEGWETCGPCTENAPAGIYIGFDISGSSGRTNPLPYYKYPDTTIHWTSSQNYITESRYNNHDSESYFQTRIGAFSNDYDDDIPYSNYLPSASFSTSYDDQNVDFTTGSSCYTYYDCDPIQPGIISASGGIEGTFVSGSGIGNEWIYKYHIFTSSGSADEPYTRSFQDFTITSGFTEDVNILLVGPGGPGGKGTGIDAGQVFYGGGGGAGQVKTTTVGGGICSAYTLKIAPGFAQPWGTDTSPTPDVWQQYFGRTIISASDGIYYESAGIGGVGSNPGNSTANSDWSERSGSGGGGASWGDNIIYSEGGDSYLSTDGGDGYQGTGSAGGGGGAGQDGFDGTSGATAEGGEGGNGLRLNYDGVLRWYGGGGAGYGPGGPSDGGLGGGGDSGIGLSTGSFYGGGGGAWIGTQQNFVTPWGDTYALNGRGSDGVVIINYKWKENTSPVDFITYRGLSQYYDMYSKDSYDGTGSLVYSLWNEGTASLGNEQGWEYNTTVLDGSGSLEVVTSSLHPYITTETESTQSEISVVTTWFSNNVVYDQSSSSYPLISDEQFGTSSFGMYAGDRATYDEAVVIRIGDTEIVTEPDTAGDFVPRQGFHISQFSYNQNTNELLWYVDGYSGSATVNEDISTKDILLSFNSSSLLTYPDANPVYPSASQATQYKITKDSAFGSFSFQFVQPQTGLIVSRSITNSNPTSWIFASTELPQITNGTGSIESGSAVDYYPSESLYPGRTVRYDWYRWYQDTDTYAIDMFYDVDTCEWVDTDYQLRIPGNLNRTIGENSWISYTWPVTGAGITQSLDTNVTQSFVEFNDCIFRPPVGLGDDSTFNLTAIYTASLSWEEMRHNDDFLYPRY